MHTLQQLYPEGIASLRRFASRAGRRPDMSSSYQTQSSFFGTLLAVTLLCGVLFYLTYRSNILHGLSVYLSRNGLLANRSVFLPDMPLVFLQSFPSLVGGLSTVFFAACLPLVNRTVWRVTLAASIMTLLLFEICLGYFHWLDVMATLVGSLTALLIVRLLKNDSVELCKGVSAHSPVTLMSGSIVSRVRQTLLPAAAAVTFSSFLAVGSTWTSDFSTGECARFSEDGYCEEYKRAAEPVYMSYTQLRNAVKIEAARSPDRIGRLYLYGNYVFLNETNEGIHVIDNTDPTAPVNRAFIRIPGNTEIAVRDNYLYADSYIDLITLDINDPENVAVISREQQIFPYDEYQNIPQNISLSDAQIDRDRGVVVSYRLNGS
ncbi:MAG: hypothetical protein AB8B97_08410 [Granulosicoccus sp.]